jgi:nicotinamide-nucleotide amidase
VIEIIGVGQDLISGQTSSLGPAVIARGLLQEGVEADYTTFVGVQEEHLEEVLRQALSRSQLIFVLGGLGAHYYDVTKKILSRVLNRRLVLDYKVLDKIKERFQKRGEGMPRSEEKQALILSETEMLENPVGISPGFLFKQGEATVIALPGDPVEVKAIWIKEILPRLNLKGMTKGSSHTLILKTCGLTEATLDDWLKTILRGQGNLTWSLSPYGEEVEIFVEIRGENSEEVNALRRDLEQKLRRRLGSHLYGTDEQTLEEVVGSLLALHRKTLAVAESCTGGLVCHKLTNVGGSSRYFERGIVSYSNEAKISLLDISPQIIQEKGPISAEVVTAMAEGVRWIAQTSLGLGITGIAGPDGGTSDKPVGLVYIALAAEGRETKWERFYFQGDRSSVKLRAAQMGLDMIRKHLSA